MYKNLFGKAIKMKAQNFHGRGKGRMHKNIVLALLVVLVPSAVFAIPNWDIYSDAVIKNGDVYNIVRVFDSPPENTTVDMTAGWVDSVGTYDESTFNLSGGEINTFNAYESSIVNAFGGLTYGCYAWDTTTVNVSSNADISILRSRGSSVSEVTGGIIDILSASEFGTVNIYNANITDYLAAGNDGTINIFGYDLVKLSTGGGYEEGLVNGFWMDDTPFSIDLNGSETYSRVILHEIPEPTTLFLFTIGSLFLRKCRK